MLINTVILFIRDTLPIFLLYSYLSALPGMSARIPPLSVGSGILLAIVLYFNLDWLSQMAAGAGLELLKIATLMVALGSLCVCLGRAAASNGKPPAVSVWILGLALTAPNAIHFLIYSVAYWPTETSDFNLVFGIIIGLGISSCLAILLYLLISPLGSTKFKWLILLLFCAGQIAPVAALLEQIDYVPNQSRLWDTSRWVADDSEYGHLFNALFGYEATPSLFYLLIYVLTLVGPLFCARLVMRGAPASGHTARWL
ncbi:FTR1 family iron permease [Alteromonas aestuariivivens]|uniref:FTR1 family iron permease n=1 Tax=Alteromonas aestuariivivens TaxID=1938339 RepID=A0A3D8M9R8_9ALTE|nr:FTR1 family iron permease [Alteromonas aestuariivivens]RDV26767.1 FTR1 family iron permease [Alteromonas aestuariivivens]